MLENLVESKNSQEIARLDYLSRAQPFVLKSLSEETCPTYEIHIQKLFLFHNFKNPVWKAIRKHHFVHHAKHDVNWGITCDLWDRVFRTKS